MTEAALKIQIKDDETFTLRGVRVPKTIWATRPFKFEPRDFAISNEYLKYQLIGADVQRNSLDDFLEDPAKPRIYAVGSEPDGERAKYFAAFLLYQYLKSNPLGIARWYNLYDRTDLIREQVPCKFLVISEVYSKMSTWRLEKVRDLLAHYDDIPRILVIAGADPVSFCYSELHVKNTHLFYTHARSVNKKVEVV